jgi:hypothetical protein
MQQNNKPTMKPLNSLSTPATAIPISRIWGRRVCDGDCGGEGDDKWEKNYKLSAVY